MKSAVMVTVTLKGELFQAPPPGVTVRPGGRPLVTSWWVASGSSIKVSSHCIGLALVRVNVMARVAGSMVVELKAKAGGAATTTGGTMSCIAGGSGGAG